MEMRWYALKSWSDNVCQHTMHITKPEDLLQLEERLAFLARSERADLALLRSRPYIQFRNTVITHLQQPACSSLAQGHVVHFWLAGIEIRVLNIEDGVCVWTGIPEPEPVIAI